jgi:hypothetical protein
MEDVTTEEGVTEQEEVQEEEVQEKPSKPVSPRDQMMEEIKRKAREQREQEVGKEPEDEGEPEENLKEDPEEDDDYLTLKIDGQEQRKKRDEVLDAGIKALQKELAADKRLSEASTRSKELEERARQLEQREQAIRQIEEQAQQSRAQQEKDLAQKLEKQGSDEAKEEARKIISAMYSGDEDDATEALAKLIEVQQRANKPDAPQVDPNEIAERTYRRIREEDKQQRFQSELIEARDEYEREYSDVAQNPDLHEFANIQTDILMRQHPEWGPRKIITEAAKKARALMPQPKDNVLEQRKDIKRKLDTVEGAHARDPGQPKTKPKTKAEIVAEMRARRQ